MTEVDYYESKTPILLEDIKESQMKVDILIIGGGASGISAAVKAYHQDLKIPHR